MKKYLIISLVLMLGLVLTGCTLEELQKKLSGSVSDISEQAKEAEKAVSPAGSITGSIFDLPSFGQDYECTISEDGEMGKIEGTVYVSGNKTRGDYKLGMVDATEVTTHDIVDGEWVYMWSSLDSNGTKIKIEEMKRLTKAGANVDATAEGAEESAGALVDMSHEFTCVKWSVDESKFEVPSDIDFMDMTKLMIEAVEGSEGGLVGVPEEAVEGVAEKTGEPEVAVCDVCNVIPDGEDKDDCLTENNCQ